jgi:hypothetical protein
MPGLAQYEELGWEDAMGWKEGSVSEPPFDKLVFMVVDALRSDFVYGEESGMNFVQRYDLSSTFKSKQSSKLSKVDRYPV